MDEEAAAHLLALTESQFVEYHQPSTSNLRKRELEVQIKSGLGHPRHWKLWIDVISATQNQYLIMQCCNLLGDLIANFWNLASSEQKNYIKERLLFYLTQGNQNLPHFLRTKLLKLLVDIGRNDWPHFYPTFFTTIESLVGDTRWTLLGLRMLRLISEEFIHGKEDIRQSRREELRKLLTGKLPVICDILHGTLAQTVQSIKAGDQDLLVENAEECVEIFSHLLTWIPTKFILPESLLGCMYFLASGDPDSTDLYKLSTGSLTCVGELAGKHCSGPEMEKNLWTIYEFAFARLEFLTQKCTACEEMSDSCSEYFQQFTELLRPLLVHHLSRFEHNHQFPTLQFLERFFHFTFALPLQDLFLNSMDIWNDFLDRILAVSSCRSSASKSAILSNYSAPILALVGKLFGKIQSEFNQELIDWGAEDQEAYLDKCIGVMVKAGEIMPGEILELLLKRFLELSAFFGQIEALVEKNNLSSMDTNDARKMHFCLRDLAVVARATSSHCGLLTGDLFAGHCEPVQRVLQIVLQSVEFINGPMGCLKSLVVGQNIQDDFVYLHSSLFLSLESLYPWLIQFYNLHAGSTTNTDQLRSLILSIVKPCLRPILLDAQPSICLTSSKSFRSLTRVIRIHSMLDMEPVAQLYGLLSSSRNEFKFNADILVNLLSGLSNILTLPISNIGQENQDWETRARQHMNLIAGVGAEFLSIDPKNLTKKDLTFIQNILSVFDGLLQNAQEDPKKSKAILLQSLTPLLTKTVHLLPVLKQSSGDRAAVLTFVLCVFSALKSAFPAELAPPLSDLFEGLFEQFLDPDELLTTLRSTDPVQHDSLATCFDLLKLVVDDPAYKSYLPAVLQLSRIICPVLEGVKVEFRTLSVELLMSVLSNHWTYFFHSVRLVHNVEQGDGVDVSVREERCDDADFAMIMRCFGGCLVGGEVSVAQLVLRGLSQLHTSRHLFEKSAFQQSGLRQSYLDALLMMLVQKDKQLLTEEVYLVVYQVAQADAEWFYSSYVPGFLDGLGFLSSEQKSGLYSEFDMEDDQVAFTEQVRTLVGEVRCFMAYAAAQSV